METTSGILGSLFEKVEAYGMTTFELSKLKVLETITDVVSSVVSRLSVILIISMFALIFNIGLALWLGELTGKIYFGFFIVAAFYLVAGIIMHFFLLKWIKKPFSNIIISQALQ